MLIIRQEQMDTMIKGTDEEWVDFLVAHVKEKDPELANKYKDEDLREMVRGGIKRAESHGITSATDQPGFVATMFEIAPNFDEQSEIKTVLDDERFRPGQRMENLRSPMIPEEVWEKARANRNENAWRYDGKNNS